MKKYHRITRQIAFSYLIRVLIFVFTPLLTVLLTRNLTVEQYGVYSLLSIIVLVLATFLDLGLFQFIVAKLSGETPKNRSKQFFSILFFDVIAISLFFLIFLPVFGKKFLSSLNLSAYTNEFYICIAIIFFSIVVKLYCSYLTANKRLELANFYEFISSSFWSVILLLAFLMFKKLTIAIVLYSWLAGFLISFLLYLVSTWKDFKYAAFNINTFTNALHFSAPLILVHLGCWLLTVLDRFVINIYFGAESVGLYSLPYSLLNLSFIFASTTTNIIYPYFAEAWHKKTNHRILLNASLKYGLMVIIPCLLSFLALKTQIITLVAGNKYISAVSIVPWLVFVPFLSFLVYLIYQFSITLNKTKEMGIIYVAGLLLNMALNIWLVPKYNIYGAAVAAMISYIFILAALFLLCRKDISLDFSFLRIGRITLASAIVAIVLYFINPQVALTKILAIILGVIIYIILIFSLRIFVRQELQIIRHFLKKMKIVKN